VQIISAAKRCYLLFTEDRLVSQVVRRLRHGFSANVAPIP